MRRRTAWLLRGLLAALGLAVAVYLVAALGPGRVFEALRSAAPILPVALALEGVRGLLDALATYAALGEKRRAVPAGQLIRAQLIGLATSYIVPGGRLAEEGTKGVLIGRLAGSGPAAVAAVTNETSTLFAGALVSIPCAAVAAASGAQVLFWALVAHAVVLAGIGLGVRLALRSGRLLGPLRRREHLRAAGEALRESGRVVAPLAPLGLMILARLVQGVEFALLAHAVGIEVTLGGAALILGVQMVSVAVGSFVPGQLGVSESMFVLWAGTFGAAPAAALAVALLAHVVQMVFLPIGALAPLVWPGIARSAAGERVSPSPGSPPS